ncbi:hypothetical protein KAW80_04680 [Candidatus Babeliales bacterium]|nr:hypothetical protein [Candidatus Babeliales bacterium]
MKRLALVLLLFRTCLAVGESTSIPVELPTSNGKTIFLRVRVAPEVIIHNSSGSQIKDAGHSSVAAVSGSEAEQNSSDENLFCPQNSVNATSLSESDARAQSIINEADKKSSLLDKAKYLLLGLGIIYAYFLYEVQKMQIYLDDEHWFNWRDFSLSELNVLSDKKIITELFVDIQSKYLATESTDHFQLIKEFLKDVRKERQLLAKYRRSIYSIKKMPSFLSKLLFLNNNLLDSIEEGRKRLNFLETKLRHWMLKELKKDIGVYK